MFINFYKKFMIIFIMLFIVVSFFISPVLSLYSDNYDSQQKINKFYRDEIFLLNENKNNNIDKLSVNDLFSGYTLFAPEYSTKTYLINYDKEVVYSWDSDYTPGLSAYLLTSGNLLRTSYLGDHPIFSAGGMGGGVQEISINGSIVWNFIYKDITHLSHHDIEPLPNGNVLMIAWEYKSPSEAIAAGRNPNNIPYNTGLWPDHIIEVEPTGPTTGEIVWEWHAWDHLIQDYDPSKDNYGVVADHPELIDINFGTTFSDWLHFNSIDYNEELDQIIISVLYFNEIWVIDHSTTTEEAAGHTGGNSGKGGDILYRWGNPRSYQTGTISDQQLFWQHDAQWIESECPGEGNILIFNNGFGRPGVDYSSVEEIVPPVDDNGNYYLEAGNAYGPEEPIWTFKAQNPEDFYSRARSGAQRLPDGNTLICEADEGYFFEIRTNGDIIWDYVNPFPNNLTNIVFKVPRYAPDYAGIENLFQPPKTPSLPNGPTIGIKGAKYTYSTSTSDPNGDQIFYWFDWGDGTNSRWIGPYESEETCIASHIWFDNGSYEIKVKAKDIFNLESSWSNPLNVIIGNVPPKIPVISGPANGNSGVEYDYTFMSVDPNNNDISYFVDWGDGSTIGWTDYIISGNELILKHSWNKGDYTIKCKARDLAKNESDWGTFDISMSRSKSLTLDFNYFEQLFNRIIYDFPILKLLLYL